ncbi:MAG: flippase activity-associated protein Agl23 [bacterium]
MKVLKKILNNKFATAFIAILILLVLSRFLFLGLRPPHHDEGMLAYFAYQLADLGSYTYTPQIHGPVLFYFTALVFKFSFISGALRISMALCGVILGLSAFLYFKKESKITAIILSLMILASPVLTYYSRFLVHTTIVILFEFCFVMSFRNFWRSFRPIHLFLSAIFLSLAFGTSETAYIFLAILVLFIPVYLLVNRRSFLNKWKEFIKFCRSGVFDILSSVLIFAIVWLLIYSVGLTNLESLKISLPNPFNSYYGLGFWLSQHPVRLGGQPWYYYILLAIIYELPALFAFLAVIFKVFKNRRPFELFLVFWTIASFVGFSWAGEKFPWLFLPLLIALTVAGGYFIGTYWKQTNRIVKIIFIILLVWSGFNLIRLNFLGSSDTRELVVYVQTPKSFQALENKIKESCQGSSANCVLIDPKITWPLSWDFLKTGRLEEFREESNLEGAKYAFLSPETPAPSIFSEGWKQESVQLRDWWVPASCRKLSCAGQNLNYFFTRKIWNDKGGFNINLYSRESE